MSLLIHRVKVFVFERRYLCRVQTCQRFRPLWQFTSQTRMRLGNAIVAALKQKTKNIPVVAARKQRAVVSA